MSSSHPARKARPREQRLRHALKSWSALATRLNRASGLWIFTDYDGTLVPIAPTPSEARLSSPMRALLRRLARLPATRVAVVSGRALSDIRRRVGLRGLIYIGNHGLEAAGPGVKFTLEQAKQRRESILRIRADLARALKSIPGAWVEYKGLTLSVHWRKVPRAHLPDLHYAIKQAARQWVKSKGVRFSSGKRVYEVGPAVRWNKGAGIERVLSISGHRHGTELWSLGDDRTDEDAFKTVNRLGGASIFVGKNRRGTMARWYVNDPGQVKRLFERLLANRKTVKGTTGRKQ